MRANVPYGKITGLAAILFFIALIATPVPAAEDTGAVEAINRFNSSLLEAMKKADELGFQGRYRLLEPVIKEVFALPIMARQSAGRYWNGFSEEQKRLYTDTYVRWTIATYAGRFDGYSGESFSVDPGPKKTKESLEVTSRLIKSNRDQVDFLYVMRPAGGAWKVVDIRILGVSQLALTRSQFSGVLKTRGFDGLISTLNDKIEKFSKG